MSCTTGTRQSTPLMDDPAAATPRQIPFLARRREVPRGTRSCAALTRVRSCRLRYRWVPTSANWQTSNVIHQMVLSPDDWLAWRSLRLAALADAPGAFGSTLAEWTGHGDTEQRWRDRLAKVAFNVVLTLEDHSAGMVSATAPGRDGAVELISLWVAPFARGHGVGDAAIDCVMEWARAEYGHVSVVLSVKSDNKPAFSLYGRHGFTDAGPSPDDPSERLMRAEHPLLPR